MQSLPLSANPQQTVIQRDIFPNGNVTDLPIDFSIDLSTIDIDHFPPEEQQILEDYAYRKIALADAKKAASIAFCFMQNGKEKALYDLLHFQYGRVTALDFNSDRFERKLEEKHIRLLNDVLKKLGFNTHLQDLNFRKCIIGLPREAKNAAIAAIADLVRNTSTLQTLDVRSNAIQLEGMQVIAEALQHNHSLTSVNFDGNRIGVNNILREIPCDDRGAQAIAAVLKNNHTLTSMNLGANYFYRESAAIFAPALEVNNKLVAFDLSRNAIGGAGAKEIATALWRRQDTLVSLHLYCCQIDDVGAQSLFHALQGNRTLALLDLGDNMIGTDSAEVIKEMLCKNSTLTTLRLHSNGIDDAGAQCLAHALKENSSLIALDLSRNRIGGHGARSFVRVLEKNSVLTALNLGKNFDEKHRNLDEENRRTINMELGQQLFSETRPPLPSDIAALIVYSLPSSDGHKAVEFMSQQEKRIERRKMRERIVI